MSTRTVPSGANTTHGAVRAMGAQRWRGSDRSRHARRLLRSNEVARHCPADLGTAIDRARPLGDPKALSPEDAASLAKSMKADVTGSGRSVMLGEPQTTGDRFEITMVARLGAAKVGDASRPKPLYLRGPDAKPQTGYALARS